jgi:hypothetical protein
LAPHLIIHKPVNPETVLHEDFSSNKRDWGLYYSHGKLQILNGKLILPSNIQYGLGLATSEEFSPTSDDYYIQAAFSTDIDTASSYGLVFGLNESLSTYYLFEIRPRSAYVRLFKYNAGKWTELVPYTSADIMPYPQFNTASVFFDKGQMELYINGDLVSKCFDKDFFQSKNVGVLVNDAGYRLLVDDFFISDEN